MSIHKVEKWCERMVYKSPNLEGTGVIGPCRKYLGFVHPATRYCEPCRKAVRRENDKKYHKEPGQQGGEHGRWGPNVANFEIVGKKALAILNAVERWRDCCDCIHGKKIRSKRCRKCFDDPARPEWVVKLREEEMKPLKSCANGDGRPICPPSRVLCKECMNGLSDKFTKIVENFAIVENFIKDKTFDVPEGEKK